LSENWLNKPNLELAGSADHYYKTTYKQLNVVFMNYHCVY
jgi:hypothetical protein